MRIKVIIRTLIAIIFINIVIAQVSVTASVDVNRISKNETIGFKIVAVNADGTPNVDISPILKDFKIISGPAQQTNIQWVNGSMTSSRSLSWTLLAKNQGKINIPALSVTFKKEVYKTNPIGITVEKGAGRAQMADLFIEVKSNKEEAYPGEQITVTYRLFTRLNLSIENIEYPKSIGFWNEDLRVAQTVRFKNIKIKGVDYKVATLYKAAMFPTQTGNLMIGPMTVICNVEKTSRRQPNDFFSSMFRETQRQFIQSDSLSISVYKYPSTPPSDFSGAVGKFFIESWVDTSSVKVNEAITLKVKLSGTGNLNQFNINSIYFPQNIEVFPPTSTFKRNEFRDDLTGEQNFEYILIPRVAGKFLLNPITLTYFNPEIEDFIIARSKPIAITVSPNDKMQIASTKFNRENITLLGNDIRYIKTITPEWYYKDTKYIPIWVWGSYLLASALFIFPVVFSKVQENLLSTSNYRESRGALKKALNNLSKPASDPFASTSFILYKYFRSKLHLSSENLDPLSIHSSLKNKVSDSLLSEVIEITKICDAGRFGPKADNSLKTLQSDVSKILKKVDKEIF